jgi:DamX protein
VFEDTPVLTHDPFVESSDELFGAGDRTRQLDELRHMSRWSRRLLVVTGDHGVGKTTLFRALSNRLETGVKAARVNANLVNDALEVLTSIAQGFGLAAPGKADVKVLAALIVDHVRSQNDANRHCLVLIDDAHVLELRAVEQVLRLVSLGEDKGLQIVFFAEAHFVLVLDRAVQRLPTPLQWHEIRLSCFSYDEVKSYLKWRLGKAGWEGRLPFAEPQLKVLYQNSRGLPGRVNEMASAILAGSFKITDDGSLLPPVHRAVLVLIAVLVGMSWLVWDRLRGDQELPPVAVAQTPRAAPLVKPQLSLEVREPLAEIQVTAERIPARIVEQVVVATPRLTAPVPEEPELIEAPSVSSAAAVVPEPMGVGDADWILARPQDHYTLQLFGTSNRASLDAFLDAQQQPERFAVFDRLREGERWYVVVYGDFADRPAADAAANSLPASVGKVEPWVRTFGSVQSNVRGP